MSTQPNVFEKRIIELLKEQPKGLTTTEIANSLQAHRHTITKYVYSLVGSGKIEQRKVGPAKICYLRREVR